MEQLNNKADNTFGEIKTYSRKKKKNKFLIILAFILVIFFIFSIFYIIKANKYKKIFFPNTRLNNLDISNKSIKEVEELINSTTKDYILHLNTRLGKRHIKANELGLTIDTNDQVKELLEKQNIYSWFKHLYKNEEYHINSLAKIDKDKFDKLMLSLDIFNKSSFIEPVSAKIEYNQDTKKFEIVPEIKGTILDIEKTKEGIYNAVLNFAYEYDLDTADVYKKADITNDDPKLNETLNTLNLYMQASISYDKLPVLDKDITNKWFTVGENLEINTLDNLISDYVKKISAAYNTIDKVRNFKTSYNGAIVKVVPGNYGWKVDEQKEASEIKNIIFSAQQVNREPEFSKKAASKSENDYGNSYLELNLTSQRLFLYKDGNKVLESDFVSGNVRKNHTTPPGIFALTYKQKNAILKGENYRTPVDYWMPFNNNIGLHDAKWRSSFGGDIYKNSGSHGCINMPPANAKILFENISTGFPVICYNLAGTERKNKPKENIENKPVQETKPENLETNSKNVEAQVEPNNLIKQNTGPVKRKGKNSEDDKQGPGINMQENKKDKGPGLGLDNTDTTPILYGPGR